MQFWAMKKTNKKTAGKNAAEEGSSGEILIFGPIVESAWWDDEKSPKMFYDELQALGDITDLHVHINSYGGHVSAGSAIYSLLKQHPAKVTVHVDGFALSAASLIAMAGDEVIMPGNAMMMIHNPWGLSMGDAGALRKEADVLDKMRESMVAAYHAKTGIGRDELIEMLDAETWFTAEEAVEKGFADTIEDPLMAAACPIGNVPGVANMNGLLFDLTGYRNLPSGLIPKQKEEREVGNMGNQVTSGNGSGAPTGASGGGGMGTSGASGASCGGGGTAGAVPTAAVALNTEALLAQGRDEGIKAERERQKAIDELAVPGMEDVIRRAKYETGEAPEIVAFAIIKAQKEAGKLAFAQREQDAAESGVNAVGASVTGDGIGAGKAEGEQAKVLNAIIKKGRNEA